MLFTSLNSCLRGLLVSTVSVVPCLFFPALTQTQLIPDDTLGAENSIVTTQQLRDLIEGGAIREDNLFHSFLEFNVNNGQQVYFANPDGILNIFTRVTGSSLSNIDGILGVDGGANLFLLNPNGINFGENAFLDVSGSFFATTGSSFVFENGKEFSATNPQEAPLLKINITPGLQYGSPPQAAINNSGNLAVGTGQSLSLYGNEITNVGNLTARGGTVQLLGEVINLSGNSQIDVSSVNSGGVVNIGGDFQGSGNLPTARRVYVGEGVNINADGLVNSDGGTVIIWSEEVTGFYGNVTARGISNGGLVEISGKNYLIFRGHVNTTAVNGNSGILLLDPVNITIANGVGDETGDGTDSFAGNNSLTPGTILSAPLSNLEDDFPMTIYESELEGLSGNTNIVLQANNNITVEDLVDNELIFAAGSGGIAFTADADGDGIGSFVMEDVTDSIVTNGRNIFIAGASLVLGNIDTSISTADAGETLNDFQVISNNLGIPVTSISGNLGTAGDVDLFQVFLSGDGTFSATTVNLTDLDTQLFLFDADGLGVYGNNNDVDCNCLQSTLPSGNSLTPTEAGVYFLGITGFGVEPVVINVERGLVDFSFDLQPIQEPTELAITTPLSIWVDTLAPFQLQSGSYTIALTGVEGAVSEFYEAVSANNSGAINLTATNGSITTGDLNTTVTFVSGNGGAINLQATENITVSNINSSSEFGVRVGTEGNSVNAGNVTFNAGENITIGDVDAISSSTFGNAGNGGGINFTAGNNITTGNFNLYVESNQNTGTGGNVNLTAGGNLLTGNIDATTFSFEGEVGDAGNITFRAGGNIRTGIFVENERNGIDVRSFSSQGISGNGGTIILDAGGNLSAVDLSTSISSEGKQAGDITLSAGASVTTRNIDARGEDGGDGGNVSILALNGNITTRNLESLAGDAGLNGGNAGNITLTAAGNIEIVLLDSNVEVTENAGNGGDINIVAGGNFTTDLIEAFSVSFRGGDVGNGGDVIITVGGDISIPEVIQTNATSSGNVGNGGAIILHADGDILLGNLDASSSFLSANNLVGNGGEITLETGGTINFNNQSPLINTSAGGSGGDITIFSPNSNFDLENSLIISNSSLDGNGGDIDINAASLSLTNTDLVTTTTGAGDSGNISITTSGDVLLDSSRLFTSLELGAIGGVGGNIFIDANSVSLVNFSFIDTATFGEGNAGDVKITTNENLFLDSSSIFSITAGQGKGGNVTVSSDGIVSLTNSSNISTAVNANAVGNGGNLNLTANTLTITDGSQLQALTRGQGESGTITVNATEGITISGIGSDGFVSGIYTVSETNSGGKGGDINVTTNGNFLISEGAVLNAQTSSLFAGGNITINANVLELNSGGQLLTNASSSGRAGNITVTATEEILMTGVDANFANRITPPTLRALPEPTSPFFTTEIEPNNEINQAQDIDIFFSIDNLENSNPNVEFSTRIPYVSISGTGSEPATVDIYSFTVETAGTRGVFDLDNGISADSNNPESVNTNLILFDSNGNVLAENSTASVSLGAGGSEQTQEGGSDPYLRFAFSEPGTYFIQVETGFTGISEPATYTLQTSLETPNVTGTIANTQPESGLFAQTQGTGTAGNITIETPQLTVQENAQISASTTNFGRGGNIEINTTESVLITNQGTILTQSTGTGNAGKLTVNTPQLTLNQQAQISAATETARGGNITIKNLNTLNINNSQISTSTQTGTAGNLNINATESITITGNPQSNQSQGLLAQATAGGTAGTLSITTQELNLKSAQITVSSPEGQAGNLEINADNLFLNQGQLTSLTAENGAEGNNQGGANINLTISKLLWLANESLISATALENADGGNVDINTGFIIAPPFPDTFGSDIAANARFGNGGRVNINTDGLFGIAFQDFPTPLNDITASSEFGDRGIVTIIQPNVDPAQSIIALPTDLIDATNLVARICPTGGREEVEKLGSFVVTGRGGLPPNPGEPLGDDSVSADLVSLENGETGNITDTQSQQNDTHPRQIVEAQGWIITENGKVILTAEPNTNRTLAISNSCSYF